MLCYNADTFAGMLCNNTTMNMLIGNFIILICLLVCYAKMALTDILCCTVKTLAGMVYKTVDMLAGRLCYTIHMLTGMLLYY